MGCRFTSQKNLQPISVPFSSIRNTLQDTSIYFFWKGLMAMKTQSQLIFFLHVFSLPALLPDAHWLNSTAASWASLYGGERETPTLTPLSAPCHQNGQSYAMINPFPTPKYIQGYSKKIGKISYTLWFGLGFFSPRSVFLLACFLCLGLRFRHRLIIPTVFNRDWVKNHILLTFWTSQR